MSPWPLAPLPPTDPVHLRFLTSVPYVWPPLQWMASGRPGHRGAAAVSHVGVAASDGSVSALGLSSGEQPAKAPRMSTDSVVPNDVLVRPFPLHRSSEGLGTIEYHSHSSQTLSTSLSGPSQSPMKFVMRTTLEPRSGRRPQLERWLLSGVPAMPQVKSGGLRVLLCLYTAVLTGLI